MTAKGSVASAIDIVNLARREGRRAQVTIGAAFGCPFEGEVSPDRVLAMAEMLAEAGPIEIALADTIGVAVPVQVAALIDRVRMTLPGMPVRVHLHNTRGTGIANAWAAIQAGATTLDASLGGIGGCPFAPAATGNIATEDLIYLLDRSGVACGYALNKALDGVRWLELAMNVCTLVQGYLFRRDRCFRRALYPCGSGKKDKQDVRAVSPNQQISVMTLRFGLSAITRSHRQRSQFATRFLSC